MLQRFSAALIVFGLFAGLSLAEDKKPSPRPNNIPRPFGEAGKVKKVDAEKGILVITVTEDDKDKDLEFKSGTKVEFIIFSGNAAPQIKTLKDVLELEDFKAGAKVRVMRGPKGKVVRVLVGKFPTPPMPVSPNPMITPRTGKVKKIDAKKGTLTLTVMEKGEKTDIDFTITAETQFMVVTDKRRPELVTGKKGLKMKQLKEGAMVQVITDAKNNARMVRIGSGGKFLPLPEKPEPPKNERKPRVRKGLEGKIKEVDVKKGTLTVTVKQQGEDKDVEVKVGAETRFYAVSKDSKKEYTGKAGLKAEEFKAGTLIRVFADSDGSARQIMLVETPSKLSKEDK